MKILGLDLGIGSIGWALIETDDNNLPIGLLGMGSRIINLTPDEKSSFSNGKGETVCSQRTFMRSSRKCLDRYQMRRNALQLELKKLGMLDIQNSQSTLSPVETWQLRADAATPGHKLALKEIGWVLLHINQKRGYRHAKSDESEASQRDYVQKINNRYAELKEKGLTVGQYFAKGLRDSAQTTKKGGQVYNYRIREKVLPRQAYKEEAEQILKVQSGYYPTILTEKVQKKLIDIIFYQRPLKSCKVLVSICDFEALNFKDKNGNEIKTGPKVAPHTSPLAQLTRIHEAVNNITLTNRLNKRHKFNHEPSLFDEIGSNTRDLRLLKEKYELNMEERMRVVEFLSKGKYQFLNEKSIEGDKLTETILLKLLGLKKSNGFVWEGAPKNGIPVNKTFLSLKEAVSTIPNHEEMLLRFNIDIDPEGQENPKTGERISGIKMSSLNSAKTPEPCYIEEPLYQLWHTVYSSTTKEELDKAINKIFGISDSTVLAKLYKIDFAKEGYANRSAKFMRRILPLLMTGMKYSEACEMIGKNHSNSMTTEENSERTLVDKLPNLKKGELRQPIIEKILNQMINIVNSIKEQFGEIDAVRIELARQLRQNKEQRAKATTDIASNERQNAVIEKTLIEHGIRASRRNIQKYKLWEETEHRCIYCGKVLNMQEYFDSGEGEIEHIIPRSIFFDDSRSNKACSCRECNKSKGQLTAYDFMSSKGEILFNQYMNLVERLYKEKRISKTKRSRLTTSKEEIPTDFLERDLGQTQYISRKAMELLKKTCRNVYASSGSVTDFFRHTWGYDKILQKLNLERYSQANLTEEIIIEHSGQSHKDYRIKDWSKRLDHRHHAIDALVIALTRQGYIQRLSNLNSERGLMLEELEKPINEYNKSIHLLEQWAKERPHFPVKEVEEAVDSIAVSMKSSKKLSTHGTRYIKRNGSKRKRVQEGILIPRGSLHNDTIYGKVKITKSGIPIKNAFDIRNQIVDSRVKTAIEERLAMFDGDEAKAKKSLAKVPLKIIVKGKEQEITTVTVYENLYATRKPISSLTAPSVERIIDARTREAVKERLAENGGDIKKFKQSLESRPISLEDTDGRPIQRVRIWSNDNMVGVRRDSEGKDIGYAMPGSNHHVAFYEKEGKILTLTLSFWNAIMRKRLGIPTIVTNPNAVWEMIENFPESKALEEISKSLPPYGCKFVGSLKMGDMYIMGLSEDEIHDAFQDNDNRKLTSHLYRVQKIADNDYNFRLHTWTSVDAKKSKEDAAMGAYIRVASFGALIKQNPIAVDIDNLGQIIRKND